MMEAPQYDPWVTSAQGYLSQPLADYEKMPIWTADPRVRRSAAWRSGADPGR